MAERGPSRVHVPWVRMAKSADTTERAPAHRFLARYMNDQLASGLVFREVAFRAARQNAGTELGEALAFVAADIAEDIATFERMMGRLEIERSKVKPRLAVAVERLARLKLNGRVLGYSPPRRRSSQTYARFARSSF